MIRTTLAIVAVLAFSGCNEDYSAEQGRKTSKDPLPAAGDSTARPGDGRADRADPRPAYHDDRTGTGTGTGMSTSTDTGSSVRRDASGYPSGSDTVAGSATSPAAPRADNSGVNARDRDGSLPTAGNQSESEADRTITQQARKMVVDDEQLSTNAKNIKIITINGTVTLRGPVDSMTERQSIYSKVSRIAGVRHIDNQLEVVQ